MIKSTYDIVKLLKEIGIYTTSDRIADFVSFFADLENRYGRNLLVQELKNQCSDEGKTRAFLIAVSGNPFYGCFLDQFKAAMEQKEAFNLTFEEKNFLNAVSKPLFIL